MDLSPGTWTVPLAEAVAAFRAALDDLERVLPSGDASRIEAELERIRMIRARLG